MILNSAAPQALGHAFLDAARQVDAERHLVMLTSGAARTVYAGWSSYGAGKAALDQWVRCVGLEQEEGGGVRVVAVAPGTVATRMQQQIRLASEEDFPNKAKFVDLYEGGYLADPGRVAVDIWRVLDSGLANGAVVDLRQIAAR